MINRLSTIIVEEIITGVITGPVQVTGMRNKISQVKIESGQ